MLTDIGVQQNEQKIPIGKDDGRLHKTSRSHVRESFAGTIVPTANAIRRSLGGVQHVNLQQEIYVRAEIKAGS